ncbi:MAG: tyrosine-type recombinase/integrase [Desulfobacteraceae bacterium]|nr:tyrosine-type recombinase/integrase [Desulfobacteraceae bacterium]MBC2718696.1 phage integrase N-terminal SAM-like domain-containing protein [Desulfobacteraceae bacterium]
MIQIPADIHSAYTSFIEQRGVKAGQHRYYVKWLCYYLDFCHKYNIKQTAQVSLAAFTGKLKEKKQAENLRKQAHHAISLFYEMGHLSGRKTKNDTSYDKSAAYGRTEPDISFSHTKKVSFNQAVFSRPKLIPQTSKPASGTNMAPRQSGADWTEVFNELKNAIKMRHYSPKTLKTYSGWVRKLQTYIKSKDSRLVSVDDVKAFLTWLAVEQDVSASSQNQAFNALLFLFRNIFKKEFGKVDGIVRAKRKPYIPVVLSREEVDLVIGFMKYPHKLIISLMYGCGLRISECLSLRVHNFNFLNV